jgi:A/G-specific adenine glycosylase
MKSTKKHEQALIPHSRLEATRALQQEVYAYHAAHGRHDLPWRNLPVSRQGTIDPYRIMVSEIMLQQTQVPRVIEKYTAFLKAFPTITALADAKLSEVLKLWSGLGYNRRAKFLHEAAKQVMSEHKGTMPKTAEELEKLPGIGPYTARAIAVFAYDTPSTFIETNIRAVFIHRFFPHKAKVDDKELLPLIEAATRDQDPREWYGALMDYGSFLKQTVGNASRRSTHHVKQKQFKGSLREARGLILKTLNEGRRTKPYLIAQTLLEPERVESALRGLEKDGLAAFSKGMWHIA